MANPPLDLIEVLLSVSGASESEFAAEYPHPLLVPEKICSGLLHRRMKDGGSGTMLVGPSKPGESLGVVSGHVLVVRKEPHKGRLDRFGKVGALGSWISVGRQSDSEVMVNDFSVSKRHARIRANETGFEIEDLGSSNQTSLNGVKLVPEEVTPLENGDMLRFGRIEVRFYLPRGLYQLLAPTISDFGASIGQALAED